MENTSICDLMLFDNPIYIDILGEKYSGITFSFFKRNVGYCRALELDLWQDKIKYISIRELMYNNFQGIFVFTNDTGIKIDTPHFFCGKKCKMIIVSPNDLLKNNLLFKENGQNYIEFTISENNGVVLEAKKSSEKNIYLLLIIIDNIIFKMSIITRNRVYYSKKKI